MKKGLAIGLIATAAAAAVASLVSVGVFAGPLQRSAGDRAPQALAADRIAANLRAAGLDPLGALSLRGRYYVLHALDPRGTEMRVLADAQFGDILSILPARRGGADRLSHSAAPRIIHVPQPDDAVNEADNRDDIGADNADSGYRAPVESRAPPVHRVNPAPRPRSEAPRIKHHIVSSARPPLPQAGDKDKALTPVYPTPDFAPDAGATKFERLPQQESDTSPPPRQD